MTGASGAVLFLEKVSPALESVDSSSGAIGTAVNRAVKETSGIISRAPADELTTRLRRTALLARYWVDIATSTGPAGDPLTRSYVAEPEI